MNNTLKHSILALMVYGFVLSLIFYSCVPHDDRPEKLDQFLFYCYDNGIFNGTILLADDGKRIYEKAFGFADVKTREPLNTTSRFYLASVSKQFTTMGVMILKEQGKLSYEDNLNKYFPEFKSYAELVTIRNLMTHTSGIQDHFDLGAYKPGLTNRDVLNLLVAQDSLLFKPGDKFSYSNGGFVLLALIVEKVSGEPFHEFVRKNIFQPVGMDSSLVYDESQPRIPGRAVGFNMFGDEDDYNILTTGAGGIYSNIEDLFKWDQALYTDKLISSETLQEAYTTFKLNNDSLSNYGFGWALSFGEEGQTVSHTGGLSGFRTYIERDLINRNTITYLMNTGNDKIGELTEGIRDILYGRIPQLPKIPIAKRFYSKMSEKDLSAAIEDYKNIKKNLPDKYDMSEPQLNDLGYYLLQKGDFDDAIEVFKLNVEFFPEVYNTYDSLGEAYMMKGEIKSAIANYEKSLELNPKNINAADMIKKLEIQTRK